MRLTEKELYKVINKTIESTCRGFLTESIFDCDNYLIPKTIILNNYIDNSFTKTTQIDLPGWVSGEFASVKIKGYDIDFMFEDKLVHVFRNKCDKKYYFIHFYYDYFGSQDILINKIALEEEAFLKIIYDAFINEMTAHA